jgi:outer membrane protein, multidrug efflux system
MSINASIPVIFVVSTGLLIGGCATSSSYNPPEASSLEGETWRTDTDTLTLNSANLENTVKWWEIFEDPTLSHLIETALVQNLSIAETAERVNEAQARRGIVKANQGPTVEANGSYTRAAYGSESVALSKPPTTKPLDLFSVGILAGWELDLWGRTQRLVEAADADIGVAREALHAIALSTAAETALAYIDARTIELRLAALDKRIALQETTLRLARQRLDAGSVASLEVSDAERLLQSTRAQRPALANALQRAENRLALLAGMRPQDELLPAGNLPTAPKFLELGVPAELLTRRPDLRQAEQTYAAAYARAQSAETDRLPRLNLSGSLKLQSDDLGNLFDPDAYIYSFGPALTAPIFNSGRINNSILTRQSQAEQARLSLESALLQAITEVENALGGIKHNRNRLTALEAAVVAAQNSEQSARELYQAGTFDLLRLTQAEEALVSVEDNLLVARQEELANIVQLYRALGGGWEPSDSLPQPKPIFLITQKQ